MTAREDDTRGRTPGGRIAEAKGRPRCSVPHRVRSSARVDGRLEYGRRGVERWRPRETKRTRGRQGRPRPGREPGGVVLRRARRIAVAIALIRVAGEAYRGHGRYDEW